MQGTIWEGLDVHTFVPWLHLTVFDPETIPKDHFTLRPTPRPTPASPRSGTSMATPHISGPVALLVSQKPDITPAGLTTLIKSMGTQNALKGAPTRSTVNLLAQNLLPDSDTATTSAWLISTTAAVSTKTTNADSAITTFN
ncbi:hypothetical protein FRC04_010453 [Tulasnella sp. 424]|nr:hypothetical protein FRC04_010453 [Tulasnella sp. 424]KAG8978615.1 hypothetical protein FRC05_009887 [Tulasnella sp. 425]